MSENTDSSSSVVVLEEGADWPKWISEYQRRAPNSVVVAHSPGEAVTDFTRRVIRRIAAVTGELRVAIVACSSNIEHAQLVERELICRALLEAMTSRAGGEVVLAARVDGCDASKHAIFALAGSLCDGAQGRRRTVRVRFSNSRPESGTMPSLANAQSATELDPSPVLARG